MLDVEREIKISKKQFQMYKNKKNEYYYSHLAEKKKIDYQYYCLIDVCLKSNLYICMYACMNVSGRKESAENKEKE